MVSVRKLRSRRGEKSFYKRSREKVAAWSGDGETARAVAVLRLSVGGVKVKSEVKLGGFESSRLVLVLPPPRTYFAAVKLRGSCMGIWGQDNAFGICNGGCLGHREAFVLAKFGLLWLTELSTTLTQELTH